MLLCSKENHQQTTNTINEWFCKTYVISYYSTRNLMNKWAEDLYGHLSKDIHMANKYMKRPTTSLIIREILIKIKRRYHLIPIRMDTIKETTNNQQWECGGKGTLMHSWWESKLMLSLWKTVWSFPRKLKVELPYDPRIPLLGIFLRKTKTVIWRDRGSYVHWSIMYKSSRYVNRLPIDKW